jgi:hypothetical protein
MKIFKADNIPQTIILRGITYNPLRCFYFLGFKLERLIIPPTAILI